MPAIDVYTQPWCPYCARAMNLLNGKGVTSMKSTPRTARRSGPRRFAVPGGAARCRRFLLVGGILAGATIWWRWKLPASSIRCCARPDG